MSRPLRIEYEGAFYHIICRGERRDVIFRCNRDKEKFLEKLGETIEKYSLLLHAYVLMDNHYHLLLETPHGNLSQAMHYLNASYGNWYRFKYGIVGSVFQGRYKAILVEKEEYLKMLSTYIHLNPVRAGITNQPGHFPFSSYIYYSSKRIAPQFLHTDEILGVFGGKEGVKCFIESISNAGAGIESSAIYGKNSMLGSEGFLRQAFSKINGKSINRREQPDVRDAGRVGADDILEVMISNMRILEEEIWKRKRNNPYRKLLVYALRRHTACSLKEIGAIMQMEYSAVSGLARRFAKEIETDQRLKKLVARLERGIKRRKLLPEWDRK